MSGKTNIDVRAVTTFTFLTAVVILAAASVFTWGNLLAAAPPLRAEDDPLTNRLAIVEPPALAVATARANQTATEPETVTTLKNWVFTDGPPTRHH